MVCSCEVSTTFVEYYSLCKDAQHKRGMFLFKVSRFSTLEMKHPSVA